MVMIRKRNRDGQIIAMAETVDKHAVGVEGRGESIVSIDSEVWAALKTKATGNGRWRLTGDKRCGRISEKAAQGKSVSKSLWRRTMELVLDTTDATPGPGIPFTRRR